MAQITSDIVKKLRDMTGAGMMDCKRALEETNGDMNAAVEQLRKKGAATAAKRADKEANQGVVEAYIHAGGRIGSMVELNCETDFVAKTPGFKQLAHDIAMQIAAMKPVSVDKSDVPADIVAKETAVTGSAAAVATGTFIHANPADPIHFGQGRVSVYKDSVFLHDDFKVGPGPKFHVYLVP